MDLNEIDINYDEAGKPDLTDGEADKVYWPALVGILKTTKSDSLSQKFLISIGGQVGAFLKTGKKAKFCPIKGRSEVWTRCEYKQVDCQAAVSLHYDGDYNNASTDQKNDLTKWSIHRVENPTHLYPKGSHENTLIFHLYSCIPI